MVERLPQTQQQYVVVAESAHGVQQGHETVIKFQVPARVPVDRIEFVPGAEPANFSRDGWNIMPDGERIYFISNPALGLWAYEGRLK